MLSDFRWESPAAEVPAVRKDGLTFAPVVVPRWRGSTTGRRIIMFSVSLIVGLGKWAVNCTLMTGRCAVGGFSTHGKREFRITMIRNASFRLAPELSLFTSICFFLCWFNENGMRRKNNRLVYFNWDLPIEKMFQMTAMSEILVTLSVSARDNKFWEKPRQVTNGKATGNYHSDEASLGKHCL